jgi:septum formation protein
VPGRAARLRGVSPDRAQDDGRGRPPGPLLVLGSASPARASLLRSAGVAAAILPSRVDEEALVAEAGPNQRAAQRLTQELARAKAMDVAAQVRDGALADPAAGRRVVVVGADSMLDVGGRVLGKARSGEEVRARWAQMAGRAGVLVTGHTVVDVDSGRTEEATCSTVVRFGHPDAIELEAYIASGEPLAVAGSCTIDGLGGPFIDGIDGDHTNVIGLSLPTMRRLLGALGVRWTDLWQSPEGPPQVPTGLP